MSAGGVLIAVGLVVLGYLFGSVSPSVFLGRLFKGLDVRKQGSGNAGTTNAFRVLGVKLGIAVLLADLLKGAIPVLIARLVLSGEDHGPLVTVFVALASIAGHNYSIFLRGRGGKGVATGAGAAIAMMPIPMAFVVGLFVVLLLTTRIVSIASIACTIVFPITAVVLHQPLPYIVVCCLMSLVVLWAHRGNFRRLWHRKEPRVYFPWNKRPPKPEEADSGPT
ncbi:MAG: glycerol-3-phosphate 1-O-acyltransferase PlsY [Thermoleophilia bacterium]|nr:glycerol-3-phosphate 1-O-acyltransferase PlsY [Thermoleophilia bacterium]